MPDNEKIKKAIDALSQNKTVRATGKAKKITATLPADLIEIVNYYKEALGYPTFSASLKAILENYFNSLIQD